MTDLYITYLARNYASQESQVYDNINAFYDLHHVIFWHNLVDSSRFRSIPAFFLVNFEYVIQLYSPILTLISFVVLIGFLLGLAGFPSWVQWSTSQGRPGVLDFKLGITTWWLAGTGHGTMKLPAWTDWVRRHQRGLRPVATISSRAFLAASVAFLLLTVLRDESFLGYPAVMTSFTAMFGIGTLRGILLAAVLVSLGLVWGA